MSNDGANSKTYFDEVAGQWDRMRAQFFSEAVRERAYEAAQVRQGAAAADIGAGTGFITEGLLRRGLRVIAVDPSAAMLTGLARKFPGAELECRQGEAGRLPLASESVEYVFANMCLHHVESPAEAIGEMARILKPGGVLVITDLDAHEFEFLAREQHDRWLGFERAQVARWFEQAGLTGVQVSCTGECCTSQSTCCGAFASIGIFLAEGRKPAVCVPSPSKDC